MNGDHFGAEEYCWLPILESLVIGSPSDFKRPCTLEREKGDRRLGQIDMFVLALQGEKTQPERWKRLCEWNGVTRVKLLLVIESWLFRGKHNFIMTHLSSRIPGIKDTEILGGYWALMECHPNDWNVEIHNWKHKLSYGPLSPHTHTNTHTQRDTHTHTHTHTHRERETRTAGSFTAAEACVRLGTAVVFMVIEAVIWGGCGQRLSSAET